jgi:hypothetical protein
MSLAVFSGNRGNDIAGEGVLELLDCIGSWLCPASGQSTATAISIAIATA